MVNERMSNSESSTDQPPHSVAWKGDVYSQVFENDKKQEIVKLKLKEKQNEEMNMMKQNQEKMQSELLQMRQFIHKYAPNLSMTQSSNDTSCEQIPDANIGHERVPQTSRIPSIAENAQPSHAS
ncbi:uncharacterized protein LOC107803913 isoform X5 [Nicotiana tabacum]|uniref:Uncharacterized protein LOC107803913 isoform X5 n=1 Tax=Nicotiana tabacum TaxID=4097 RepID=A0AC58TLJ3_TOBAC